MVCKARPDTVKEIRPAAAVLQPIDRTGIPRRGHRQDAGVASIPTKANPFGQGEPWQPGLQTSGC